MLPVLLSLPPRSGDDKRDSAGSAMSSSIFSNCPDPESLNFNFVLLTDLASFFLFTPCMWSLLGTMVMVDDPFV